MDTRPRSWTRARLPRQNSRQSWLIDSLLVIGEVGVISYPKKTLDTYHGHFVKLVTNEQVVEVVAFETTEPPLGGEMTITITLADADSGTDVLAVPDGLPRGESTDDKEVGGQHRAEVVGRHQRVA